MLLQKVSCPEGSIFCLVFLVNTGLFLSVSVVASRRELRELKAVRFRAACFPFEVGGQRPQN
jgi:hypothetical protein